MHFLCNPCCWEYILCRIWLRLENPFDIQKKQSQFQPFEGCPQSVTQSIHFKKLLFFFLFGCCAVAIFMYSYSIGPSICWFVSFYQSLVWGSNLFRANILARDASWQFSLAMLSHIVGKAESHVVRAFGIRTVACVCTMAESHLGRPGRLSWNTIEKCLQD